MSEQNQDKVEPPTLIDVSALKSEPPPPRENTPGILVHVLVFAGTAGAAFLGYTLLF